MVKQKTSNSFKKNNKLFLILSAVAAVGIVIAYFSFAGTTRNYIMYGTKKVFIPGQTVARNGYTKVGITTFGGRCDNKLYCNTNTRCNCSGISSSKCWPAADNGISALDNKPYRAEGSSYVALRIPLPADEPARTNMKNFLKHKTIVLRRNTGQKDSNGNWIFKYATARLDDWGPSESVISAAKSATNNTISTVVDVSPEIAAKLGLGNSDQQCNINGSRVTEKSALGKSDGKTVEIGFSW